MSDPISDSPGPPRILLALSAYELACFEVEKAFNALPESNIYRYVVKNSADAADWARFLKEVAPEILVVAWAAPALPTGWLEAADCSLRYFCFVTGSVRRLVPRWFVEKGGNVTNWGDTAAPMVAEHALLLLLAALRRLPAWNKPAPAESQEALEPMGVDTKTLYGATVSIHGFGQIARRFIRLLQPFDVQVRVFSEGVPTDFIRENGAEPVESLAALFKGASLLVEMEALTPQSERSVTAAMVDSLANEAVFVNVGRGLVVDQSALARRAVLGEIHLALDVLEVEPPPPDSPLLSLSNVLISPHIAGPTRDQLPNFAVRAAKNIQLYLAGKPLDQPVSLAIYDRST